MRPIPHHTHSGKVFGIGLSRTGTLSLHKALLLLGLKSRHYQFDMEMAAYLHAMQRGMAPRELRLSALETYQCVSDVPVCALFEPLDRAYPGSKFILTTRDETPWLESCQRHFTRRAEPISFLTRLAARIRMARGSLPRPHPLAAEWRSLTMRATYGTNTYSRSAFAWARKSHLNRVHEHFKDRPEALLLLDICGGEGWDKLCPFLGVEIPAEPFLWEHKLFAGPPDSHPGTRARRTSD